MTLEDDNRPPETSPTAETPKRRGRPPKDTTAPKPASAPSTGSTSAKALAAMTVQESRWGRISLSEQVTPTLPAGRYPATISNARVWENDSALGLCLSYEVTTSDGEVFAPDDQWLRLFDADAKSARVRDGRVMLSRIAAAVADQGITIDGLEPRDIADALVGATVTATVAVQGQGVGRKNVVRGISAPAKG